MNRYTINTPPDINLYDGNISSWTNKYNRQIYSEVDSMEHLLDHHQVNYKYDLAGRLTESVIDTFNFSSRISQNKYKTEYEYDLNGNMDIVSRTNENGFLTTNTNTFQMAPIAVKQTNRLMTTANLPNPGTSYLYDNMGNLTYENTLPSGSPDDVSQIHWTADGKIAITSKTISVTDSITHAQHYLNMFQHYYYDGMGNRVLKIGNGKLDPNSPEVDPILLHCNEHLGGTSCKDCQKDLNMRAYYYAREAGGKVLATYETTPAGIVALTHGCYAAYYFLDLEEWYIYGSESDGRISTLKPYPNEFTDHLQVNAIHFADQAEPYAMKDTLLYYGPTIIGSYQSNARITGYREYEIKDHLGNVRAVISDIKNPMEINLPINDWTFKADIRNLSNYYPYGMQLPKGTYSATDDYSYGYNGMEKDDELRESLYSTLFREGDTENGRWWSRDPLEMSMPYQSPYTMMDANPIKFIDPNGDVVQSTEEEWAAEDEGLDATLGEDHPFSFNESTSTWEVDKDYDISHYSPEQKEIYDRTVELIDTPILIRFKVISKDEKIDYHWGKFSGSKEKRNTLRQFGANGLADPIYTVDKYGEKILVAVNIYVSESETEWIGWTSLHETIGHTYLYLVKPELEMSENLYQTFKYMSSVREIYYFKSEYNFVNKVFVDIINFITFNYFGMKKHSRKKIRGKETPHNEFEELRLKNEE